MLISAVLKFLFPPFCLHCQESLEKPHQHFCDTCNTLFTLLDQEGRCSRCFLPSGECSKCREGDFPFCKVISAFEYLGPAASLIQKLKYGNQPYLAKDAAAFLTYQYLRLDLPLPDLIVPVPISFTRYLIRGYNQSMLLAQEMGKLLNRPAVNLLKRYSGDLPQTSLNRVQREALAQSAFCWKKRITINGKVVLLIDDVRTTGTTLQHVGNLIKEGYPTALYGMTFCV